jgi:capsular polysaccharide export protein
MERARGTVLEHSLSKYNHAADFDLSLLRFARNEEGGLHNEKLVHRVLVIDQTLGDMSVELGGASTQSFAEMLAVAKAENPSAIVVVKTHPEVSSGRKGGYLTKVQPDDRTVVLRDAVNPMSLLHHMDKVYVVTSTMGFEALLAGKPVVCFGVPWYAGWGVTDDRCKESPAWARRTRKRSVRELFAAAYIHYTRYLDPVTQQRGGIFDVMGWLVRQKDMANRMHGEQRQGRVLGVGFRRWKAANLKPMLGLHQQLVTFATDITSLQTLRPQLGDTVVCWGAQPPEGLVSLAQQSWARLLHAEDGFIRSVGLGSDLIRPQSLVLDERGIYFDATRPSDLEVMLATRSFTPEDLARAQAVRAFIVQHGITKYNLEPRDAAPWGAEARAAGRTVVLVPGQVEDDASIRLGCTTVCTNLALLQAVRGALPNAFIVYKSHPDVASGNRKGRVALQAARQWVDHIETTLSVVSCIDAVDEVHTMTSLTGFDALLRGRRVVTYGQPFYAGWGLTEDRAEQATAFERRTRRLSLDELVAGALLHYPIYWDWTLKGYTTCEAVLHRIVEERTDLEANGGLAQLRTGWLRRQWRKAKVIFQSIFSR